MRLTSEDSLEEWNWGILRFLLLSAMPNVEPEIAGFFDFEVGFTCFTWNIG